MRGLAHWRCVERSTKPRSARAAAGAVAHRAPPRAPLRESIRVHNAREHNSKNIDVEIPRDGFTVVTGVSGSGKSTLAFDIVFAEGQRRYLESLNAYARQFVQPASTARRRRHLRHSADGRDRAAHEPRRPQEHGRDADGDLPFPAAALRQARRAALPGGRHADRAAERGRLAAQLLRDYRGRRITLLAPLVVARKGYYTDLAKWAARQGFAGLRVDGTLLPTDRWPRLDRFKEHSIELPVAELVVDATNEQALRGSSRARSSTARASSTCLRRDAARSRSRKRSNGNVAPRMQARCSRPSARAPRAAAAFPISTRGSFRSIRSTGGARAVTAPG